MAARLCIEPGCNDVGTGTRCPTHTAARRPPPRQRQQANRDRDARRGNTTERGYGSEHQARRARLLPTALGTACPICLNVMVQGQALNLHHSTPLAHGGRHGDQIVHAACDQREGGKTRRL